MDETVASFDHGSCTSFVSVDDGTGTPLIKMVGFRFFRRGRRRRLVPLAAVTADAIEGIGDSAGRTLFVSAGGAGGGGGVVFDAIVYRTLTKIVSLRCLSGPEY